MKWPFLIQPISKLTIHLFSILLCCYIFSFMVIYLSAKFHTLQLTKYFLSYLILCLWLLDTVLHISLFFYFLFNLLKLLYIRKSLQSPYFLPIWYNTRQNEFLNRFFFWMGINIISNLATHYNTSFPPHNHAESLSNNIVTNYIIKTWGLRDISPRAWDSNGWFLWLKHLSFQTKKRSLNPNPFE